MICSIITFFLGRDLLLSFKHNYSKFYKMELEIQNEKLTELNKHLS